MWGNYTQSDGSYMGFAIISSMGKSQRTHPYNELGRRFFGDFGLWKNDGYHGNPEPFFFLTIENWHGAKVVTFT